MATEDDKPHSTFTMEKLKEGKEISPEDSSVQVPEEKMQEESVPEKSQGCMENNFRVELLTNDIEGSHESNDDEKSAKLESRDLPKFEDDDFRGDPHHTSFPIKEEFSEVSSAPADTKIDPEITETKIASDFAENVSMEGDSISPHSAFPKKYNETMKRESEQSNKEQLSSPLVAESKENQNKYLEEVVEANSNETALDKAEEGPELGCNRSAVESEDNQTQNFQIEEALEIINHADSWHASVPLETAASGEDSPSDIYAQEQKPNESVEEDLSGGTSRASETKAEDTIQEYRGTPTEEILEAQRTDDRKNITEQVKEEDVAKQDLKSSTHETCMEYSVIHNQNNKEQYIIQATKDANLSPEEVNQDISPSNLIVEEHQGSTENGESNGKSESTKGDGSLQEFPIIAQANDEAEEANNLVLLDVNDHSVENPKEVIPQTAQDVWEQKEFSIPKDSEEQKEINEQLSYATNLVPQVLEENSCEHNATEEADDSFDTNAPRRKPGKEETSIEKAHVDDESLNTSSIYSHENPQEQQADKESIINLDKKLEAGKVNSIAENELQDHGANVLVDSGEIQTIEYHVVDKTTEDRNKGIAIVDPDSSSIEAVVETNVAQISSAATVVDELGDMPSVNIPNLEETLNITESKNDSTNTDRNIVYVSPDDSFATGLKEELLQTEENKSAESEVRGGPTKEIEECNGTELKISESKEYLSAIDDALAGKDENSKEPTMEEKTEDRGYFNSENTITDDEHSALSQSQAEGNQPIMKDEKYEEVTEPLSITDQNPEPEQEISSFQEFSGEEEIKKDKHMTEEKDASTLSNNLNQIDEAITSDNTVEKIGYKTTTGDSGCGSLEHEVNQKTYQEHELKPEADPSDQKVVEESSQVLIQEEVADYSHAEEQKDKSLHEDIDPEVHPVIKMLSEDNVVEVPSEFSTAMETNNYFAAEDPEAKADEITNSAGGSKKCEEPENINTTHSFPKQLQNVEKVVEGPHLVSTAEQIVYSSPAEEEKEENNVNETKKIDELKPVVVTGSTAEDISETRNDPSYSTKIPTEDEIVKGDTQVAQEISNDDPAEEEQLYHKDMTAPDQLKAEEKSKEVQITEETQRFRTEISSDVIVVQRPPQFLSAEDAANYIVAEEGKVERDVTRNAMSQVELTSNVDLGTKEDETSETLTYASESTMVDITQISNKTRINEDMVVVKGLSQDSTEEISSGEQNTTTEVLKTEADKIMVEETPKSTNNASATTKYKEPETTEATWGLNTERENLGKDVETLLLVSFEEEAVKCNPAEERNTIGDESMPAVDTEVQVAGTFEITDNASQSTKLVETDTIIATQSFHKQTPSEDQVDEEPCQYLTAQKTIDCTPTEEGKEEGYDHNSTKEGDLKSEVYIGVMKNEIPETFNSESQIAEMSDSKQRTSEDKFIIPEEPHQVSTSEEITNNSFQEEDGKNVNDIKPIDELTPEADQEVRANEIPEPSQYACGSTTRKLEEHEPIDVTKSFKKQITSQDRADELDPAVYPEVMVDAISEITDIESAKLEEIDMIDATQSFKKQSPSEDQVEEDACQVVTAEKARNYTPAEEEKEEGCVSNSTKEDDLKSEGYTGVTKEISETTNSEGQREKMTNEDKINIIEEPHQVSTSEEIGNSSLPEEEGRNINDTTSMDEIKIKVDLEVGASKSSKFQEPETINATQTLKRQMQGEKVVEGPPQFSNAEEIVNPVVESKEELTVNEATNSDELNSEMVNEISDTMNNLNQSIKLKGGEMTEATWSFNTQSQMASEEKIVEVRSQDSTPNKILDQGPSEQGNDKGTFKDTTSKDELEIEKNLNVHVEEVSETPSIASETTKELIDVTESFGQCQDNGFETPCESPIAEERANYSPEGEVMEARIVKDAKTNEESKSEDDTGVNIDEISEAIIIASANAKSFKEKTPSKDTDAEGPLPVSTELEVANYSPTQGVEEGNNVKDRTTRLEQAEEFTSTNTEIKERNPNPEGQVKFLTQTSVKKLQDENEDTKYQEEYHSSLVTEQDLAREVKSESYLSTTQVMSPYSEDREATNEAYNSNMEMEQKENPGDLTEANNNSGAIHVPLESPIAASDKETMVEEDPKAGTDAKIASEDEEITITKKSATDETLEPEMEELDPDNEAVEKAVSSIPQERSFKDDQKEEKVEEHGEILRQTSVAKLNEDKKVRNQDEYHSSLVIDQDSTREVQSESLIHSKRPTDDESREVTSPIDSSNRETEPKDDMVVLTDSAAILVPLESSIAVSDMELTAKEDPKTGTDFNIANEDEKITTMKKGPTDETPLPEIEELEPENKAVARSESSIPTESSFKDDVQEEKVEESAREVQREALLGKKHTEGMLQDSETREITSSNKETQPNDDLEVVRETAAIHMPLASSVAASDKETMAEEDPKAGTDTKIANEDEEITIMKKSATDETLEQEMEELEPANEAAAEAVSSMPQESSFKDDGKEEKVEEHGEISRQTSVANLNEDQKVHDQDEYHSTLVIEPDSAREVQSESLILSNRPTEARLPDSESTKVTSKIDNSNREIEPKDDTVVLKDTAAVPVPLEIAALDMELTANENPTTGTDVNIPSEDEKIITMQKGPTDETPQPEMEELEPENKAVARSVSSIQQESSFRDDIREEKVEELAREVQNESFLSKKPTEGMLPESETREITSKIDSSNRETEPNNDLVVVKETAAIHVPLESSIAASDKETMAEEDPKAGTDTKIASEDEEITIMKKSATDETLEQEMEELEPANEAAAEAVSSMPQESSFKDEKEHGDISRQTSVANLNEDQKVHNQDEYHSSLVIGQDSAREFQSESLLLSKIPTEGRLTDSQSSEVISQFDSSNREIEPKDDMVVLKDTAAILEPLESSIAVSDTELTAKEDPKTGTDVIIASEDEKITTMQKGPTDEIPQPEMEESEPESKAVARSVSSIPQESSFKDDVKEEKVEDDPAEFHSEQLLSKIPTERMFPDSQSREVTNQIEGSNKEIMAREDPKTGGTDAKIANQGEDMSITKKDPADKKLEPDNASGAVAKATSSIPQENSFKEDKKEEKDENSAGEVQNEPHLEKLSEGIKATELRHTETMLPESGHIEAKGETAKSTLEEASMTSLHDLLQRSRIEKSKVPGDFKIESDQTIQRDETKDGIAGNKPNSDEEVENDTTREAETDDSPVIVKVTPKKSHNILSGVGSKVKHSIAKVKKAITGKSSGPKQPK